MKKIDLYVPPLMSLLLAYLAWQIIPELNESQVQPIASTVSTFSGILFGFVMASVIVLATAKDNKLVQNTQKTKYLPKLVSRLHTTMGLLLAVCIIFLICLFLPDSLVFKNTLLSGVKYVSIILVIGVSVLTFAICKFFLVWNEFKNFAHHM